MQWSALVVMGGLATIMLAATVMPATGQAPEPNDHRDVDEPEAPLTSEKPERQFHPNHVGGLLGISRHLDAKDTAFTLGLDYTRQFTRRWALATYVESVSSNIERDAIVGVSGIFYLMPRWTVLLGPGIESAARETTVDGEKEEETELELMIRAGTGCVFRLTPTAGLGPAFFVDWASNRWTVVLGLATVAGF